MHGVKERGRPSKIWMQSTEDNLKKISVTKWWEKVLHKYERSRTVMEAKAHDGL